MTSYHFLLLIVLFKIFSGLKNIKSFITAMFVKEESQ